MIRRYRNLRIAPLFTDEAKLNGWQIVELAVIQARETLDGVAPGTYRAVSDILTAAPFDIAWWLQRDKEINHDLNAFLEERVRHLPAELTGEFHRDMTSYDTEDPAFALKLVAAAEIVREELLQLFAVAHELARAHRHTVMLKRTHGQGAKLGSFGVRVLTWIAQLSDAAQQLYPAIDKCRLSRISGATGNYGGNMSPELEQEALALLGLRPYYGATQIVPRTVHAPLAQALLLIAEAAGKIALDVRLSARSGMPLMHEPFGSVQKGSSAMPHKKNPIICEQMEGLVRLARGYASSLTMNISTSEERAIEQSCVERVAWPDLLHTVSRIITQMTKVLKGLVVYKDHMLQEVILARGTYASDEAKNWLAKTLSARGHSSEVAYRIVQLASFCVFEPGQEWQAIRSADPSDFSPADALVLDAHPPFSVAESTICSIVEYGCLRPVATLAATAAVVEGWNELLRRIFSDDAVRADWREVFRPSRLLRHEAFLFDRFLAA